MSIEREIEKSLQRIGKALLNNFVRQAEAKIKGQAELHERNLNEANDRMRKVAEHLERMAKVEQAQPRQPTQHEREAARLKEAYATLGVSPGDSIDMAKAIYRAKAKMLHPDTATGSKDRFQLLEAAYELVMVDMRKRGAK